MKSKNKLFLIFSGFILFYFLPLDYIPFKGPFFEAFALARWYAREHVLLCLIPAFFIAGAISVFISQTSVIKYLGTKAKKIVAYGVSSISGTILAVCSCTVLPLFSGIYKKGAGLGPAITFLYSGPAINALAIILTARILGWQFGLARAIGAISFSIAIGLLMHFIFLREEKERQAKGSFQFGEEQESRPLWKNILYFASMIGILIFINWARPSQGTDTGIWKMNSVEGASVGDVTQNLNIIYDVFAEFMKAKTSEGEKEYKKTKKKTLSQKKEEMFSGLLIKFSGEISGAARRMGFTDFADALNSGILMKPLEVSKYIPVMDEINIYKMKEAQQMIKYVMRKLDSSNIDANYNFIKEMGLRYIDAITNEDILRIYDKRNRSVDSSRFMDPDRVNEKVLEKEMETIRVPDMQLLDVRYLALLSTFFKSFT